MRHFLFFWGFFLFVSSGFAAIEVQSVSGADTTWTGYMENHITYCNKRKSSELLTIVYKSDTAGEARLVDERNQPLWQKPNVLSNQEVTLQIPWSQLCWSMGNHNCKNPQSNQFKIGISSNNDSLLQDFHILYVRITDRCVPSEAAPSL